MSVRSLYGKLKGRAAAGRIQGGQPAPGADHSERARDTVYGYVWRSPYAFTIYTLNSPLPVHHTVHAYIAYGVVPSISCAAYIPQTPLRPVHEPSLNTNIGGLVRSRSVQYIYYSHPFLYGTQCTYGESHREGCVRVPRSAPRVTSDTGCTAQLQRCVPAGPCLQWEWDHGGRVRGTHSSSLRLGR